MLSLQLSCALECATCEQLMTDREDDFAEAILFGAADPYVFCPGCCQQVPTHTRNHPEYRRRARVRMFEKFGIVAKAN